SVLPYHVACGDSAASLSNSAECRVQLFRVPYCTEQLPTRSFGVSSMKVTDVAIQLAPQGQDRLRGFCCITLDGCFVVRDIKIINGPNGLFVAMPSRKIMASCPGCRTK